MKTSSQESGEEMKTSIQESGEGLSIQESGVRSQNKGTGQGAG